MITDLTAAKLDAALLQLELEQRCGEGPQPGEVSLAELARRAEIGEATVHEVFNTALSKVARGLRERGLPPRLARVLVELIDDPQQPELF
ncbi:hypothetical protein [Haloferula sp. BvORR071]|uniref:hypothetical protein n=1 Tax=Haloferula sp. BvORR071 TaxID=1396141 RepID=UPI00055632C5|nr:hypothetical protein [Haloferula sp. BvORR071]